MKNYIQEFKEFIKRGNVVDLAVGIVIGAAFTGIVNSLVEDVIMPPIGLITGGIDFSALEIVLKPATDTAAAVTINYGSFINTIIEFIIISIVIFVVVKQMNKLQLEADKEEKKSPSEDILLLREIRDLLKKK